MQLICSEAKRITKEQPDIFSRDANLRAKDEKLFFKTHHDIKVCWDTSGEWAVDPNREKYIEEKGLIHEDKIVEYLLSKSIDRKILAFEGPAGTGKSELCNSIYYKLVKNKKPVLRIPKSESPYNIITKIIPSFMKEYYGIDNENDGKQADSEMVESNEGYRELLAHAISSHIILELENKLERFKIPENKDEVTNIINLFRDHINYKLLSYIKEGERSIDIFEVEDKKIFRDFFGIEPNDEEFDEINSLAQDAILKKLNIDNLDTILTNISSRLENEKNKPIMIIEDISKLGSRKDQFLNFFYDLKTKNFDLIYAGTTGAMDDFKSVRSTELQRTQHFIFTSENDQYTFTLNKENCVDFIKPYLSFFKEKIKCKECVNEYCNLSKEKNDLFPFTNEFIITFFDCLERKFPRQFVEKILRILMGTYIHNQKIPSESNILRELSYRENNPKINLVSSEYYEIANLYNALIWYGELDKDKILLNKRLAEVFELEVKNHIDENENYFVFPAKQVLTELPRKDEFESKKKSNEEYNKLTSYIITWLDSESSDNKNILQLENLIMISLSHGIQEFLEDSIFTDFKSKNLKIRSNILELVAFNKKNIKEYQLLISNKKAFLSPDTVEKLLEFGIQKTMYGLKQKFIDFISDHMNASMETATIANMWKSHFNKFISDFNLRENVLGCYVLTFALENPFDFQFNTKVISNSLLEEQRKSVADQIIVGISKYSLTNRKVCNTRISNILNQSKTLKELVKEIFRISELTIDTIEIERILNELGTLEKCRQKVSEMKLNDLKWLDFNKLSFSKIINDIQKGFSISYVRISEGFKKDGLKLISNLEKTKRILKEPYSSLVTAISKFSDLNSYSVNSIKEGYNLHEICKNIVFNQKDFLEFFNVFGKITEYELSDCHTKNVSYSVFCEFVEHNDYYKTFSRFVNSLKEVVENNFILNISDDDLEKENISSLLTKIITRINAFEKENEKRNLRQMNIIIDEFNIKIPWKSKYESLEEDLKVSYYLMISSLLYQINLFRNIIDIIKSEDYDEEINTLTKEILNLFDIDGKMRAFRGKDIMILSKRFENVRNKILSQLNVETKLSQDDIIKLIDGIPIQMIGLKVIEKMKEVNPGFNDLFKVKI